MGVKQIEEDGLGMLCFIYRGDLGVYSFTYLQFLKLLNLEVLPRSRDLDLDNELIYCSLYFLRSINLELTRCLELDLSLGGDLEHQHSL